MNDKKCIACHTSELSQQIKKILNLFSLTYIICNSCGATFRKSIISKNDYTFVKINDTKNNVWKKYNGQTLTSREWVTIGNGGMSDKDQKEADEKQRQTDLEKWLEKISLGNIKIVFKGADTSVIFRQGEELLSVLPNVSLKEPRAVRQSSGGYAGPTFRIAKGVSFKMGRFGSTSESHQEIRDIDSGILTITNERLVFSGNLKTINIDLRKIFQIDPFTDGFAIHKEGREKTQYFEWSGHGTIIFTQGNREYEEPINGMILKCIIEGAIRNSNK